MRCKGGAQSGKKGRLMGNDPTREGFFWGRWHTPCPGTADAGEPCGGQEWEVHHVFENEMNPQSPNFLRVFVPGVEKSQPLDAFEWGAEVRRDA